MLCKRMQKVTLLNMCCFFFFVCVGGEGYLHCYIPRYPRTPQNRPQSLI